MAPPSLSFSNIRKTLDPNRQICWSLSIFKEWIIKIMIFFVFCNKFDLIMILIMFIFIVYTIALQK